MYMYLGYHCDELSDHYLYLTSVMANYSTRLVLNINKIHLLYLMTFSVAKYNIHNEISVIKSYA